MSPHLTRRALVAGGTLLPLALASRRAFAADTATSPAPPTPADFPRQDPARVAEVVGAALARGARATIFSAAMLGQLAVVRAFVEASPGVERTAGPHGIPLVEHARAGGPPAAEVLAYLEGLPDASAATPAAPSAEQRAAYVGRYRYGPGAGEVLEVRERGESVTIRRDPAFDRFLVPTGPHAFHPAGVPAVRVRFTVTEGAATEVVVHDGPLVVTAQRIAV